MNQLIRNVIEKKYASKTEENFRPGDTVSVHVKIKEGEKERIQQFKGSVLKIQGAGNSRTFTVRKVSNGVGVERTFPIASPVVNKVEVISHGKVRRSKLFYLREREGRSAKIESELVVKTSENSQTK